jgi:photosystem II cytochrome c550
MRFLSRLGLLGLVAIALVWAIAIQSAQAAGADIYVTRFLQAREPVPITLNSQGDTRLFSPEQLTVGKRLFEANCKGCHVGGSTLPNPLVSLTLQDLRGATPPRDNITGLVDFQRLPKTYDGQEDSFSCRQVTEEWIATSDLEDLAAFILRAAAVAPNWGQETF